MKKLLLFILLVIGFTSCEVDTSYDCYTFQVTTQRTYSPYRPGYYDVYEYYRCGMTSYNAYNEARSNEYYTTYYQNGYYITERQTCTYWRRY